MEPTRPGVQGIDREQQPKTGDPGRRRARAHRGHGRAGDPARVRHRHRVRDPGTHSLEFYRPLRELGITAITTRHEQGASYGADGWSRCEGCPGWSSPLPAPPAELAVRRGHRVRQSPPMILLSPALRGHDFRDIGSACTRPTPPPPSTQSWASPRVTSGAEYRLTIIHDAMRTSRARGPAPSTSRSTGHPETEAEHPPTVADGAASLGEPPTPEHDVAAAVSTLAASERPVILAGGGSLTAGTGCWSWPSCSRPP
ncbi:hypothetical protein QJS66_12385 [Kocuria rhizophila]|nr:hypothetical protein QJS66_12385 [Kocuria rhizophila]